MALARGNSNWTRFIGLLDPGPSDVILDLGAGKGTVAKRVFDSTKGGSVFAIDPDKGRVEAMKERYPELRPSVAEAEKLPFPDSTFTKVYTTFAVHHFSDFGLALQEAHRVLSSGGSLVVVDIDPGTLRGRLLRAMENGVHRRHMNFRTAEEVSSALASHGFSLKDRLRGSAGFFILGSKEEAPPSPKD